jgi:heme-degrading monooxygenase HmoA
MIEIVCEFVVKVAARSRFEMAYGPGGAWSELFARQPGFRGTTLLGDTDNPRRYLTVELWDTEAQREQTLAKNQAEYAKLRAAFCDWTECQNEMGIFRVLAEATVRPFGRARPGRAGQARRRSRRAFR